jgi:hypothetical protein
VDIVSTVKLSQCLTNYALHHEGLWGSGCVDPHFLDLGTILITVAAMFKSRMTGNINIEMIYIREIYYSLGACSASHINLKREGKF